MLYHHLNGIGADIKVKALQVNRKVLSAMWFVQNHSLLFGKWHVLCHMSNFLYDLF
jgi:hypothetical protein